MEQFSLDKYLENPQRKVMTRDGREVDIFYSPSPINRISLIGRTSDNEVYQYTEYGFQCDTINQAKNDLFFADEEEQLTEFEKVLKEVIEDVQNGYYIEEESFGFWKDRLLDLARKELEANYYTKVLNDGMVFKSDLHDRDLQGAYEMGKQDALKSLPKWKKATEQKDFNYLVARLEDDRRVVLISEVLKGDYYIDLKDLKTLPKEE